MTIRIALTRRSCGVLSIAIAILSAPALGRAAQIASPPQSAHEAAPLPLFEVISIKPDQSDSGALIFTNTADGFEASGFTAQMLIHAAYGYNDDHIVGASGWLNSDRFILKAKVADTDIPLLAKLGPDQRNQMLQQVLTDRFQLKVHRETRQLPVYSLIVAKSGTKLKESSPLGPDESGQSQMRMKPGLLTAKRWSIPLLVEWLSLHVDRIVQDQTRLTGVYDFTLQFSSEQSARASTSSDSASTSDSAPSIYTALQEQLGLKLEPTKGPVEVLAIDQAEKPSEN